LLEEKSVVQVGGSVERALQGDYQVNVVAVLKEAWQLTQLSRSAINTGLFSVLLLGMLTALVISNYLGGFDVVLKDPTLSMILNIVVTLVIWPFLAGVEMMGVYHAVGLTSKPKLIFAFLKRGSWISLCALVSSLLISIGLQLFVVPGLFLAVTLSLVIPLIIEKRMTVINALILSIKAMRFQWLKVLVIYTSLAFALTLLIVPLVALSNSNFFIGALVLFFFGLSYLAPMFYNCKGILYREIFGMKMQTSATATTTVTDNTFSA
jgi:hypothetical protein